MGETCSKHGRMRNTCNILVVKRRWKIPLGRPVRRLEDNIEFNLEEIGMD
jgi:hypothetical protein